MMKTYQLFIATLVLGSFITSCGPTRSDQRIRSNKIIGKPIQTGACIFGAKSAREATITTRGDCRLRGGAFAPDANNARDESNIEIL